MKNAPPFCSFIKKLYLCSKMSCTSKQITQVCRNQNSCQLITSFFNFPHKLFILSGLWDYSKNTKYLLLKGLFNTISTIKKEINSTLLFINLSHHRTCRLIYESFILYTYCVELYLFCIHPANRHFFPIFRIRLIASERKLLFRYLTTKDTEKYFFLVVFSYG